MYSELENLTTYQRDQFICSQVHGTFENILFSKETVFLRLCCLKRDMSWRNTLKFIQDSAIQWLSLSLSSNLELITAQVQRETSFSSCVFPKQGSLGKPRVSLWRPSARVRRHLQVKRPPALSLGLSFHWVFGFCTQCSDFLERAGPASCCVMLAVTLISLIVGGSRRRAMHFYSF